MAELGGSERDSSEQLLRYSTTTLILSVGSGHLSSAASTLVNQALNRAVCTLRCACADMNGPTSETESTQVLVPIHAIPEDSMACIPASPSFVTKHTTLIDAESTMNTGLEIHRNRGESRISDVTGAASLANARSIPTENNDRGESPWSEAGEYETMIDEMSSAVAAKSFEGIPVAFLQDLYDKFAEVAQTVSTFPAGTNPNGRRDNRGGVAGNGHDGERGELPPEVKERVLKTLSEVKLQLDNVRNQLMRDKKLRS